MHPPPHRPVSRFTGWPLLPLVVLGLAGLSASASCAVVDQLISKGIISPPKVTFQGADLVSAPSQLDISAYYCPRVLGQSVGITAAADFLCSRFFGKAPPASAMQVGFDLRFDVANPNQIPLPLSEILTALTVFPGETQQNLGAVCLSLCAPDDAACVGGKTTGGCQKAAGDVKSMADFPGAALNMLVAQGLSATGGRPAGFKLPKVLASSHLPVTARLALTPEALLPALEQLARQSVNDLKAGKSLALAIPYRTEGTVFADLGSLGRVAAGFGPVAGMWPLPTQRLLP